MGPACRTSWLLPAGLTRPARYGLRRTFVVGSPSEFVVGGDALQNPSNFQVTSFAQTDTDSGQFVQAVRNEAVVSFPGRAGPQSFTWNCSKPGCRGPSSLGIFYDSGERLLQSLSVPLQPRQPLPGILNLGKAGVGVFPEIREFY